MTQPAPAVTPDLFWDTMTAFQRTAALKAAIDLEVFTKVAEGNLTAADIAKATDSAERGIRILCDSLTAMGFITKDGSAYSLTEASALFLDKRSEAYLGSAIDFIFSPLRQRDFNDLTNAVKHGGSRIAADALLDPESGMWVTFARAMAPLMFPTAQGVASHLDYETEAL